MQEASTQEKPTALPSLTGMRWLAAALVFGFHVRVMEYFGDGPLGRAIDVLFGPGATGVSFFFILSGFVIAWSARPRDDARTFWRRRFARVYPLHLVTALLALALAVTLLPHMRPTVPEAVSNLLLVHSWNPDYSYRQSLNPVSWSLACEAFFYAVFPLVYAGLRRLGVRALYAVVALCAIAVVVVPLAVGNTAAHFSPAARLPEFVLGITLACLVRAGAWRGPGLRTATGVVVVGYVAAGFAPPGLSFAACTLPGFALLIAAAAVDDARGRVSWVGRPALVRLGELSFAFYMIHVLLMRSGEALFARHPQLSDGAGTVAAAAALALSLALAWVLYEAVERPAHRFLARPRTRARSVHTVPSRPAGTPSGAVPAGAPSRAVPAGVPQPRLPYARPALARVSASPWVTSSIERRDHGRRQTPAPAART